MDRIISAWDHRCINLTLKKVATGRTFRVYFIEMHMVYRDGYGCPNNSVPLNFVDIQILTGCTYKYKLYWITKLRINQPFLELVLTLKMPGRSNPTTYYNNNKNKHGHQGEARSKSDTRPRSSTTNSRTDRAPNPPPLTRYRQRSRSRSPHQSRST